jgi:hypothetical protein
MPIAAPAISARLWPARTGCAACSPASSASDRPGRYLIYRYRKRLSVKLAPVLGRLTKHGRLHHQCHRHFATLAARNVELSLLYADGDVGLAELDTYFGEAGKGLATYPNASLTMLADADHNFTHLAAGRRLLDALMRIVAP